MTDCAGLDELSCTQRPDECKFVTEANIGCTFLGWSCDPLLPRSCRGRRDARVQQLLRTGMCREPIVFMEQGESYVRVMSDRERLWSYRASVLRALWSRRVLRGRRVRVLLQLC